MTDKGGSQNDDQPPSLEEITSSPAFDRSADAISKSYIFLFFVFCGVIAYLDEPNLGWWWAAILVGGLFASSLLFAAPVTMLKLFLGTKGLVIPFSAGGKLILFIIDLVGYVGMWFATRYVIALVA